MDCQLQNLPAAGGELGRFDRLRLTVRRAVAHFERNLRRVLADPGIVLRKLGLSSRSASSAFTDRIRPDPLGLRAGERVRVKSLDEIRATLDDVGDYEGLGFMSVQKAFCGGEFTVHKRVEHFFDERTRRMLKIRNTVILSDVYCEPPVDGPDDYAGCQRTCFLFWKEAWLERA